MGTRLDTFKEASFSSIFTSSFAATTIHSILHTLRLIFIFLVILKTNGPYLVGFILLVLQFILHPLFEVTIPTISGGAKDSLAKRYLVKGILLKLISLSLIVPLCLSSVKFNFFIFFLLCVFSHISYLCAYVYLTKTLQFWVVSIRSANSSRSKDQNRKLSLSLEFIHHLGMSLGGFIGIYYIVTKYSLLDFWNILFFSDLLIFFTILFFSFKKINGQKGESFFSPLPKVNVSSHYKYILNYYGVSLAQNILWVFIGIFWIKLVTGLITEAGVGLHNLLEIILMFWFIFSISRFLGIMFARKIRLSKKFGSIPFYLGLLAFITPLPVMLWAILIRTGTERSIFIALALGGAIFASKIFEGGNLPVFPTNFIKKFSKDSIKIPGISMGQVRPGAFSLMALIVYCFSMSPEIELSPLKIVVIGAFLSLL